jgi:hypothetical protein
MNHANQLEIPLQPPPPAAVLKKYEGLDPSLVHLDEREAAVLTNQSPKTLESWRNRGEGLPFLKLGRRIRYRLSDVLEFLDRNTFTSTRAAKTRDRSASATGEARK